MAFALVEAEAGAASIKVLHINDHHSYIEGDKFKMNTSAVLTGIGEVEIRYGGFPRIATVMHQHSDSSTLKLHAGDAITGTLWYTIFKGAADAAMMGQVCFDAFALGNHEFDDGDAALSDFLTELAGTGCDTQVRACAGSHLACGRTNL
jgi:5'-nucleotidase